MAIEALFNEDYDSLLKRARIESATDAQTVALIDMSVSEVRIGFYKTLGADRVNQITAIALVENVTSDDEILRADAANIEALWLTYLLLPRLPVNFMATSHLTDQIFNEEPLTRDADSIGEYLTLLKQQIDKGLSDLVESPDDFESVTVRASSVGPDEPCLLSSKFPSFGGFLR